MKKKFQATDAGLPYKQELVIQSFSAPVEPGPEERMSELKIVSEHRSIQHAEITYLDREGAALGQHDLLTMNETIRPSVMHVPEGTIELRLALTLPADEICDWLDAELNALGKYQGLFKLGLHVYRINRNRGVSLPRFIIEKTQQLFQLGLGNFLASPSRHVDLREVDESNYEIWKSNCTEQFLAETGFSYPGQFEGLTFIVRLPTGVVEPGSEDFRRTVRSITRLNLSSPRLLIIAEEKGRALARTELEQTVDAVTWEFLAPQTRSGSLDPGAWYCVLQAGDVIRAHAAWVLSQYAAVKPAIAVFYSDHDHLNGDLRLDPEFKPAWSREFYLHEDYIHRSVFFRGRWFTSINADLFQPLLHEGLMLDAASMPGNRIGRIPDILFSFAPAEPAPAEVAAGRRTLVSDILNYQGILHAWRNNPDSGTANWLEYLPASGVSETGARAPLVSLIIPTRDQYRLLSKCVDSIRGKTRYPNYELIIVDNGSKDGKTLDYLRRLAGEEGCTVLEYRQAFNFSAINNFAFEHARGELVGLINNDIEVCSPGWLHDMAAYFNAADVGVVGAKLLYGDRKVQHAGVICGVGNVAGHAHRFFRSGDAGYMGRLNTPQEYSAVTGACLLTRAGLYRKLGGLNEKELAVAYNDIDFCLRVRQAGYRIIYAPQAELIHHESKSRGSEDTPEKFSRYKEEKAWMWAHWNDQLLDDEYYNPNLTRVRDDFSLRSPPTLPIMLTDT
jgi:GT2 family glycosyltransferase